MDHVSYVRLIFLLFHSLLLVSITFPLELVAQVEIKNLQAGSLRSWFASTGCEIEEGRVKVQQDGLEWPAFYRYQDCEAAKGMWIGVADFTDQNNVQIPYAVVHVGPRVAGTGEVFPMRMDMVSKFEPPKVYVDGNLTSSGKPALIDAIDPSLSCDRMIINDFNTLLGISINRKILAFSQGFHDNYFIYEYTFKNTGNINTDTTIELRNQTLTGVYFFFQYRYAPCQESRYVINNETGWGKNTMNDARGDGLNPAGTFFPGNKDNNIRAQYSWHGKYPPFTAYDNIGASVWSPPQTRFEPFSDRTDTSGRLCAPQFVGIATLHADRSSIDHSDDPAQPSTTTYESSDDPLLYNNRFPGNSVEYDWMRKGHMSPRHADKVGLTGDPSQGFSTANSSGGQSVCNGYGPYTLRPGDSVRIVMAEAVAGLSRERAISVGERFKLGEKYKLPYPTGITAAQKNDSVYTGRDSLFQTFKRAIANFRGASGTGYAVYDIPKPPDPPTMFDVKSGSDKVTLTWEIAGAGPAVTGFRIFRATGKYDGDYAQIHQGDLPPTVRSFVDAGLARSVGYFYYIVAVGDPLANTGGGGTPPGVALISNRAYSQAYDAAFLKRPPGISTNPNYMDSIRIVPNPYSISSYLNDSDPYSLRFPGQKDKIAFFNIPGRCTIRIYTELGELINTIEHDDGTGDDSWNSITSSRQVVVSGVYIVVFENKDTGQKRIQKFVVIR